MQRAGRDAPLRRRDLRRRLFQRHSGQTRRRPAGRTGPRHELRAAAALPPSLLRRRRRPASRRCHRRRRRRRRRLVASPGRPVVRRVASLLKWSSANYLLSLLFLLLHAKPIDQSITQVFEFLFYRPSPNAAQLAPLQSSRSSIGRRPQTRTRFRLDTAVDEDIAPLQNGLGIGRPVHCFFLFLKSKRQKGGGSTRKTIKIRTRKKNHSVAPFCGGANRVGRVVAPLQNGLGIGRPIVCFFFCFCSFWRDQNGEKGRGAGKIGKKLGKKIRKKWKNRNENQIVDGSTRQGATGPTPATLPERAAALPERATKRQTWTTAARTARMMLSRLAPTPRPKAPPTFAVVVSSKKTKKNRNRKSTSVEPKKNKQKTKRQRGRRPSIATLWLSSKSFFFSVFFNLIFFVESPRPSGPSDKVANFLCLLLQLQLNVSLMKKRRPFRVHGDLAATVCIKRKININKKTKKEQIDKVFRSL